MYVLTHPDYIERYRLATIRAGLRLEAVSLRHSKGSVAAAARAALTGAGIPPARNLKALNDQYREWFASLPPLPPAGK